MKAVFLLLIMLLPANFLFAQAWQETYNKADSLMQKRDFKNAISVYEVALELAEKEFGRNTEQYLKTRNGKGRSVIFVKMKEEAEAFLTENIELCKIFGEKTEVYATALYNAGTFYYPKGNNPKNAELYLKQALQTGKEVLGERHPDYALPLNNLALLYKNMGNYIAAEPLYKQALQILKEVFGEKHPEYAASLNNLALLYKNMGNYPVSESLYKQALQIQKEILGEKHPDYALALNNLALLYKTMGNYSTAEPLYKQALQIQKEILGEKHPNYALSLNNLASLYRSMGNYVHAEPLYKHSLQIRKEVLGEKTPGYAASLNNLASFYSSMGNYSAAEQLFKQVAAIYKEILGEKHPEYAASLNNLSVLYTNIGNYSAAVLLNKHSMQIRKEVFGEKHPAYAASLNNLSVLYNNIGNYSAALPFYMQALQTQREILGEKHPDYALSLYNFAVFYRSQNLFDKSLHYYIENLQTSQHLIKQNFPVLSEKEKTDYFNSQIKRYYGSFNSFAVTQKNLTGELYNAQLFTKGILLSSTQKMKNRIANSQDSVLIKEYEAWNSLKLSLAKYQQMSKEEIRKTGLNLDSLENVANETEKLLSQKSESFAQLSDKKVLTWRDIQKTLKKSEAAIEIVRINKFGVKKIVTDTSDVEKAPNFPKYPVYGLTDTVYYVALIVKKKSKQPELVLLKNGNDLEKKFVNYQKNAILYKREDAITYNEFWKPIAEKLKGIKKVYFSPDGVYNQISLNTLQNPETKKYVLDEIELHLVTNTKDILTFGKSENKNLKAELLGYPLYDLQTENADESRKRELATDTTRAFNNFQKVSLLPGTKKEVEDISKILKQKNYELEVLTEKNASEENVKQVKSPKILHLSTHGFFIDSKEKNEKINPMLRSGLLLTGVSDYTRAEIKPDTEDGILTALEAANLDLDETDLVVLSACETGLGDVKAGEGVYGLQRAFKVAGAKSIVMSMWKVDDAVTQKLMTTFYQKFAEYNNARKAFKEAQAEIKKQYPEPYFWGAFVMTGE